MAENEVSAKFVAEAQRTLEIDRRPLPPPADRRARERLGRGLHGERAGLDCDDRQARSGAGDRSADRDRRGIERGGDGQIEDLAALHPAHLPEIGDDAAEHAPRLRVRTKIYQPPLTAARLLCAGTAAVEGGYPLRGYV